MYKRGEKPGKGKYQCANCGCLVELENSTKALENCPKCKGVKWWRLNLII